VDADLLAVAAQLTDANAAIFERTTVSPAASPESTRCCDGRGC